jgi:VWFA-related protein
MNAKWKVVGLAVLGILGLCSLVSADDIGRLVSFDVAVTDKNDNVVAGLRRENFRVFEDNVERTISAVRLQRNRVAVVVLQELTPSSGFYQDEVVEPAAGFLRALQPDDWAALVSFEAVPTIVTDFTSDKKAVINDLRGLRVPAYGAAALFDSVYFVLERMKNLPEKKAIFLVASGLDTMSYKRSLGDMLKKAEVSDTTIYTVNLKTQNPGTLDPERGPGSRFVWNEAEYTLAVLAESSGGLAFTPLFPAQYRRIYEVVNTDLRNQYTLSFVSHSLRSGDKLRKLKVEVVGTDVDADGKPDKLKVRHKRGFLGAGDRPVPE